MSASSEIVAGAPGRLRRALTGERVIRFGAVGLVFAAFIGIWYLVSYVLIEERRRFIVPPAHAVIDQAFFDGSARSELFGGLLVTSKVALTGLAIAIVLGGLFAVLMSQARILEWAFYPYAVVIQTIPILALVPLIGFWFGFNFQSRVIVCVMISLFPIITNTLFGLKSADRGLHDVLTLRGASRFQRFYKLQLPSAAPSIFVGLRISAGLSVIGAIVGDFFFRQGEPGLGILLDSYRGTLQSERLFGAVILSSLLGLAVFLLFGWLANLFIGKWHESAGQSS
jgi:NitT/TauT family transport system permease protein